MRKPCLFLAGLLLLGGMIATSCITINSPPSTAAPTPPATKAPISTPAVTPPATTTSAATPVVPSEETAAEELRKVQDAVKVMMQNNKLTQLPHPVTIPTNDMRRFPDASTRHGIAGVGYVLYCHDFNGDGTPDTNYIGWSEIKGTYVCDEHGNVTQVTTGHE